MIKLMGMELRKSKLFRYIIVIVVVTVFESQVLIRSYTKELLSSSNLNDYYPTWQGFISENYFFGVLIFSILSSVLFSQIIIKGYQRKSEIALYRKPVLSRRLLLVKLLLVVFLTVISGFISNFLCFTWFTMSVEGHLALDSLTLPRDLYVTLFYSLIGSVTAAIVGVLAMSVGFLLQSIPITIITGIILSQIFIKHTHGLGLGAQLFLGGGLLLCLIVSYLLVKRVNRMEVW